MKCAFFAGTMAFCVVAVQPAQLQAADHGVTNGAVMVENALTNDQIVALVKAGAGDETIISLIEQSKTNFDSGLEALMVLHDEGVSSAVINAVKKRAEQQAAPAAAKFKPITCEDVITLSKAGLSDAAIIAALENSAAGFDLDTRQLLDLKTAGVSNAVIEAMQKYGHAAASPAPQGAPPAAPGTSGGKAAAREDGLVIHLGAGFDAGPYRSRTKEFTKDIAWENAGLAAGQSFSGETGQTGAAGTAYLFGETAVKHDWKLGFSLGLGLADHSWYDYRASESDLSGSSSFKGKFDNFAAIFPAEIYVKYSPEKEKHSFILGMGADYLRTTTNITASCSASGSYSCYAYNFSPFLASGAAIHASAGGEYFISSDISLGVNLKYLFGGKVRDLRGTVDGVKSRLIMVKDPANGLEHLDTAPVTQGLAANERLFEYDYSGPRINISLKYYFGGRQ